MRGRGGRGPVIVVRARSAASRTGFVEIGGARLACALGRAGRRVLKREGDGATPVGRWPVRQALYRADRMRRPRTAIPVHPIRPADGWCDAPADRNYNRRVQLPYPASAEEMWRTDALYDVVVVLGCNDAPRRRGLGSAIFMHLARPDRGPTAGCIALSRADLLRLLARLGPGSGVLVPA